MRIAMITIDYKGLHKDHKRLRENTQIENIENASILHKNCKDKTEK